LIKIALSISQTLVGVLVRLSAKLFSFYGLYFFWQVFGVESVWMRECGGCCKSGWNYVVIKGPMVLIWSCSS